MTQSLDHDTPQARWLPRIDGARYHLLLGTIVGATCLGLLTAFAGFFFPEWITFTIFLIMIVLIIVRPQGILG